MPIPPLRKRPAYQALADHHAKIEGCLRGLFNEDPTRGERLSATPDSVVPHRVMQGNHTTNALIRRYRAMKGKESEHGD